MLISDKRVVWYLSIIPFFRSICLCFLSLSPSVSVSVRIPTQFVSLCLYSVLVRLSLDLFLPLLISVCICPSPHSPTTLLSPRLTLMVVPADVTSSNSMLSFFGLSFLGQLTSLQGHSKGGGSQSFWGQGGHARAHLSRGGWRGISSLFHSFNYQLIHSFTRIHSFICSFIDTWSNSSFKWTTLS